MMRGLLAVGILALVAVVGAAGWALRTGDDATITGTVLVKDLSIRVIGSSCSGARPFLYLHPGTEVVVRDAAGEVAAEGALDETEAIRAHEELEELERAPSGCQLSFEIGGVPQSDSYTVEIAGRHEVTRTRAELEETDWFVELQVP